MALPAAEASKRALQTRGEGQKITTKAHMQRTMETHQTKDKSTKAVTAFFRNQLYRTWGLMALRRWARLLLDGPCL